MITSEKQEEMRNMKQKVINFIDEVLNFYEPVFLHPTSYVR